MSAITIENKCPYVVDVTFKREKLKTFPLQPVGQQGNDLGTDYKKRIFEFRHDSQGMKFFLWHGHFMVDTVGLRGRNDPAIVKYYIKWNDLNETDHKIVNEAKKWLGARYKWGGNNPKTGIDCSGLTKYVYKAAAGIILPRTADGQWKKGPGTLLENWKDLTDGDLIFFRSGTTKNKATHVGIYVGGGKVLSAQSGKTMKVKISPVKVFGKILGGRHINT